MGFGVRGARTALEVAGVQVSVALRVQAVEVAVKDRVGVA